MGTGSDRREGLIGSDTGSSSGPVERVRTAVSRRIRIDTRTLAVFRVAVGLLILADLLLRARSFSYFYTDAGVVPRWLAMEAAPENAVSVYYLATDPTLIGALFVVQALIAVGLVVGYRTRIAAVLSFLLVISLDHHNPLVLSHADVLFRLLLFWALFLPLGERWSVDAVHADREPRPYVASPASALILLQMVYMYVFNGYHKSYSELWTGGEATVLILGLDNTTYLLGDLMRTVPTLLQYGGLTWYYMLLFAWLLVVLQGRTRLLFVGMFMAGHASFILTVRIGAFGYVALAGLSLFLQAQFWEDGKALLRYAGVEGGRFRAMRGELQRVGRLFPDLRIGSGTYRSARSLLYDVTLGVVVVTIALLIGVSLLQTGGVEEELGHDRQIENVAASLAIDQPEWTVFAPTPRTVDRYYVFPARTADGEVIDAYNDRPLSYERPHDELQKQFGTYRERFYMNSVRRGGTDGVVPTTLADHKCERWYEDHGVEITHLNMYYVAEDVTRETIDAPDERDREITLINKHGCGDTEPEEIEPPDW